MKKRTRQTMNRFRIRAIAFVIVFAMALSALTIMPMDVFASTWTKTSGECGENLTWTLDESSGTLTISGSGKIKDNAAHYEDWDDNKIYTVIFNGSITSIGRSAFEKCHGISSIQIPNTVTNIGEFAFAFCSSLKSITIPNSVTAIGYDAFLGCGSLTSITIPNSVTTISNQMFCDCVSLTSIIIPNSVLSIGSKAFYNCYNLKSVTIPDSITSIPEGLFYHCIYLESIELPNSVTSIEQYAFFGCSNLTSITLPNSIKSIKKAAYKNCDCLTDVYFLGSEDDWNRISIWSENDPLQNAIIHFNSNNKTLKSISVKKLPTKTKYYFDLDKEVDTTGLVLTATYDDGTTKEIVDGFTCHPFLFGSETGKQTVTVTYEGKKTSFDVNIIPVKSLELKKKPNKLLYERGENADSTGLVPIDTTGMILLATYEDGVKKEVTKNFDYSPSSIPKKDFKGRGKEITIKFGGKEVKYRIAVSGTFSVNFRSDGEIAKNSDGTYKDISHTFYYSDRFFYYDNKSYHNDLAIMSLGMEIASYSSHDTDSNYTKLYTADSNGYCERAKNIKKYYDDLGFENARFYHYNKSLSDYDDKVAFSFANKPIINENGNVDTLVTVVIRGGGYGAEWASNFNVGNSGNHIGFQTAANEVYHALESYLPLVKNDSNSCVKLWITGFSRGAAVANLTAHMVNNSQLVDNANVYAYTFATPKGYFGSSNASNDNNIFNIISANDLIPKLACKQWGFGTYGQNMILPNYTPYAVQKRFNLMTGLDLNVGNNYHLENEIINSLVKVAPSRDVFFSKCQRSIVNEFSEAYRISDGNALKIPLSLFVGIKNSDADNKLKGLSFLISDSEYNAYNNSHGDIRKIAEKNCSKLLTIGLCHYPEHYLAWLETGGYEITNNSYAIFSSIQKDYKDYIETQIKYHFTQSYERHCVSCPVDVKVYDSSNNLVVSIVNNEVEVDELPCYVEGETKYFYTYGDDFRVELTGNGTGNMDYQVQEFNSDSDMVRTVNHYDLALTKGKQYTGQIKNTILDKTNTYALTTNSNTVKPAYDSMTPVGSKHKVTIVNGASLTESAYQNECVEIIAEEKEGKYFSHWTSDAGDGIFNDAKSEVTNFVMPNKDVKVTAVYDDAIPGDLNKDKIVNAKDSALLSAAFGKRQGEDGYNAAADFNKDGIINAKDKAIISQNFGKRK